MQGARLLKGYFLTTPSLTHAEDGEMDFVLLGLGLAFIINTDFSQEGPWKGNIYHPFQNIKTFFVNDSEASCM